MERPLESVPDEYDSPWKEALGIYLRPMLEFCFPHVASAIDWTVEPKFLDRELQQPDPGVVSAVGLADALARRTGAGV